MRSFLEILHRVAFFFLTLEKVLVSSSKKSVKDDIKSIRNDIKCLRAECSDRLAKLNHKKEEKETV